MTWLSEHVKFDHATVQPLETFSITPSTMSNYNVNEVLQGGMNDLSIQYSSDSWSLKDVHKAVKPVKPIKNKRGCYIRKSSWTSTNITSFLDDGHSWRKYGQKEIINATHQRNYYRCTHKFDQGCKATKQVQKIENEPPKYKITYNRHHSCKNFPSTPQIILDSTNHNDTSILLCFESNGVVENKQVGPYFPIDEHKVSREGSSSLELRRHEHASSFDYKLPHDLITSDSSEHVSQTSPMLDQGDVMSTIYSPIYETGHMLDTIDFSEIPFDFTHSELTNLYYL